MNTKAYQADQHLTPGFFQRLTEFTTYWLRAELPQKTPLLNNILDAQGFESGTYRPQLEEAYLEFLMLGVLLETYGNRKLTEHPLGSAVRKRVGSLESDKPQFKKILQRMRGTLLYLLVESPQRDEELNMQQYKKLIAWMDETQLLRNESAYLRLWGNYLESQTELKANSILSIARLTAGSFTEMAERVVGSYSDGLTEFLRAQDQVHEYSNGTRFMARSAGEFYLNMFGAEVISRLDKEQLEHRGKRAMLWSPLNSAIAG